MGTHSFRLSDIIPNSWFQKLKEMGRIRNQNTNHVRKKKPPSKSSKSTSSSAVISIPPQISKTEQPNVLSHQRKSYYFTRELTPPSPEPPNPKFPETFFPESPRKSPKQRKRRTTTTRRRNRVVTSSVSAGCSCHAAAVESLSTKPDSISDDYPISPPDSSSDIQSIFPEFGSDHDRDHGMVSFPSSCYSREKNDVNIIDKRPLASKFNGFDEVPEIKLRPIVTKKPTKLTNAKQSNNQLEKQRTGSVRSPGVRLRVNSPKIASRKSASSSFRSRRVLSESFAVVKTSADPHRDFKESMLEMIMENNLRSSKDLEDLLACYLQLNSGEYHELIVQVFKQIWFDFAGVRVK